MEFGHYHNIEQYKERLKGVWPKRQPMPSDAELGKMSTAQLEQFYQKAVERHSRHQTLIHSPIERKIRYETNLKTVLDWLRWEPYSTSEIMALVTRMSVPGTRKMLNKMVRDGWLVRDEIPWIGVAGKIHLFGISSRGLYHLMDEGEEGPNPNRDFKRGRVKASTGEHVLSIQLARLYLQRYNNPNDEKRTYQAARDLPFFGKPLSEKKRNGWKAYPDAVIDNSHYTYKAEPDRGLTVAVEIERIAKGSKRYRELIYAHMENMETYPSDESLFSERYDHVIYYLPSSQQAKNLERLFHALIDQESFCREDGEEDGASYRQRVKNSFEFDTYADLVERIKALDA